MNAFSGLVATAAVVSVMIGALPVRALAAPPAGSPSQGGAIVSEVRDEHGLPVAGAVVSAVGRRIVTGVTNEEGECTFASLPAGDYLVRVFSEGHVPVSSLLVIGAPGVGTTWSFVLEDDDAGVAPAGSERRDVLAAGFIGAGEAGVQAAGPPPSGVADDGDHDHGEVAWRLRHLKRTVLRDAGGAVSIDDYESPDEFDKAVAAMIGRHQGPAQVSASLVSDFSLGGQVNLLTTGAFDSPQQLMSAGTLARGVALVSLGASAGRRGDWAVQGAMTQGDVASWMVSGSYLTRTPANHVIEAGLTYSLQRYDGSNPAALEAVADGDRYASVIYAFDSWTISRRVSLAYGYIEKTLFSPRARLTVTPVSRLRVSVGASRQSHAPGAEEFVPSMAAGTWLPPERTFSPLAGTSFVPERTTSFDIAAEHELSESTLVGVRTFYQGTKDQLATMFGLGPLARQATDLGHYYVGSAGDVEARGWTVSVRQVIARRVRGGVDYTVTTAEWHDTTSSAALMDRLPGIGRSGSEQLHDVTTSLETDIPVTDTRVFALYRINTGYASSDREAPHPALAARFDVQVTQSLPFMNFTSAQWEMLFGVRNLFRDIVDEASFYDELLTVRPPKRVVGGLTVRF
jgi:Carboxypeptidase regulatory-like domain